MYKKILKKLLPFKLKDRLRIIFNGYSKNSYSQEGEDLILRRLFEQKTTGFYVDVGAHHPIRFSNTYAFYKMGWYGINIDAMPGSMKLFNRYRPRDINIETPVSSESKSINYYIFNVPELNGFDPQLTRAREQESNDYKVVSTVQLKPQRLDEILSNHLPQGQHIDFLSIDVEGLDMEVLKSNDWAKYKPDIVLMEVLGQSLADLLNHEVTIFLKGYGYTLYAKAFNSIFYRHENLK